MPYKKDVFIYCLYSLIICTLDTHEYVEYKPINVFKCKKEIFIQVFTHNYL